MAKKMVSLRVEGLSQLKSALKTYHKKVAGVVDKTLMEAVKDIGMTAKTNCKIQSIGQTIAYGKINGKYSVTTEGDTSVYLEFGTGNFAKTLLGNYPQDWKDMAMRFYINGLGRSPAEPYLYPAYQKHAGEAVLTIEDRIEGL